MAIHETVREDQRHEQARISQWWTPKRMKAAGLSGIVGGVVLAATAIVYNAFGFQPETFAGMISGGVHAVTYALMLFALLAVHARYGDNYGQLGRVGAWVLGIALAVLTVGFGLLTFVFGMNWMPGAMAVGIAFLAIHLFGVLYGVVLWRRTDVSPLAAGLLIAVVPAFVVTIAFEMIGISLTAAAFEVPLYLGFAALGYQLWERRTEVPLPGAVPQ